LSTVQVKTSGCISKSKNYQVALKSCGGTKGKTYKTLIDTDIDYLFILLENKDIYLITKDRIKNKTTINICDKYKKFKVEIWLYKKINSYNFLVLKKL